MLDIMDKDLKIGDEVVFTEHGSTGLIRGTVTSFTNNILLISYTRGKARSAETRKPSEVFSLTELKEAKPELFI